MTGATSTTGGGGGAAARTLTLLQASAYSRSTALTNPADICFIISFPQSWILDFRFNRVTGAPESGRCSVGGNVAQESSCRFRRVSHATALSVQQIFPVDRLSKSLNSPALANANRIPKPTRS